MSPTAESGLSLGRRLWIYQRERFPIFVHGPVTAVAAASAVVFSARLGPGGALPRLPAFAVGFLCAFLFFFELRVADEFKDYADDSRFRPYRAVPRGLVSFRVLATLAGMAIVIQVLLVLWLNPELLPWLLLALGYLGLMSQEFFVREWLRAHPIPYLVTHMPVLSLLFLFVTACDWRFRTAVPPSGVWWFLAAVLCSGLVFEVGRKIRAPQDEERGVETYTFLWGRTGAVVAWLSALGATTMSAIAAATSVKSTIPVAIALVFGLAACAVLAIRFLRQPLTTNAKRIDQASALWNLVTFLCLGVTPLLVRS